MKTNLFIFIFTIAITIIKVNDCAYAQEKTDYKTENIIKELTDYSVEPSECKNLYYSPYVYRVFDSLDNFRYGIEGNATYLLPSGDTLYYTQFGYSDCEMGGNDIFRLNNYKWEINSCIAKPDVKYVTFNNKKYLIIYSTEYMAISALWRSWIGILNLTDMNDIKWYEGICFGIPILYGNFNNNSDIDFISVYRDNDLETSTTYFYYICNNSFCIDKKIITVE